jgi:protein involved in polysaccharide export with SLBB domain
MKFLGKRKIALLQAMMVAITMLAMVATGCSTMRPAVTPAQITADPPPIETLVPGDEVEVKLFYTPKLDEKQMIRPDGTITLQLVGKVKAQGKTPEELRNDLLRLYAPDLKKPKIEVLVRNKSDRKVYVSGEVKTPGNVDLKGDLTVLEAIKQAGGFVRPGADIRNVLVVRQKNGKQSGCVLNLQKAMEGQEEPLFFLQPRDVVYVPPTSITKVNDWVEQHINRMIPRLPLALTATP